MINLCILCWKCYAFNLNCHQRTSSKYLKNFWKNGRFHTMFISQRANCDKTRFSGRKEHNLGNWEQCWELSKFMAEGGNRWINIFHGRKKSWVLLMRRKLDIFSEIRLRCAPGCYPKLWKFEWILNWREGQIESPFLCSYTKWIVNEVCEQSIRILERFLNFRMALWKYHKLHNHERKL